MSAPRRSIFELAMVHWRIALTLTAVLLIAGAHAFLTMQRQEFPEFTIRQGLVVGVMPGATSEQVQARLAQPVEDFLFSFKEVDKKKTYSISRDGQVVVFVELNAAVKGLEAPAFWAKLRHGLNELRAQRLPPEVVALIGVDDFGDTSALLFTVVAKGRSPRDLEDYVDVLQTHLRRLDATSKLRTFGARREVIRVSISRERLATYGIRPLSVLTALKGLGVPPAPARLDNKRLERPIHVEKVLASESELAETIILSLPTGQHLRLRDVAEIKREYGHDDAFVRYNGQVAMVLSIEMQPGHDITHFGKQVDAALAATRKELPQGVTIARVADQPKVVAGSIHHFLHDFGLAIASVIVVIMLLLPLRVAWVAALSIPISITATFAALNALGVKLQTVSLAGLVVVLGMIVDNAIVVIDDHVDKLDHGMSPWQAAWRSAQELAIPVFTATLAIIFAYAPIPFFQTGLAGDFSASLPLSIAVALLISLLVAVFLIPILNARFLRRGLHEPNAAAGERRPSLLDRLQGIFDVSLDWAFRHRAITLGAGLLSIAAALFMAAGTPQQMFPKVDRNQFAVEVYLPRGRSLAETDRVLRGLEKQLLADKRVSNVTAFVGQSSPRFHTLYAPKIPSRNFGQLLVNTVDEEATLAVLKEAERRYQGVYPEGWVRWKQLDFSNRPAVAVRLSGQDVPALKRAAEEIAAKVRTFPGATWVRSSFEEPLQTIAVKPNRDDCARLGVPPSLIQLSLAQGTQGVPVATIWEDDYPVQVLLKDPKGKRSTMEGLRQQYISSLHGGTAVRLEQLAKLAPAWHEAAFIRRNGVPTITVRVDVDRSIVPSEMQKIVERYVAGLDLRGIRVSYGGDKEFADEVMSPMIVALGVSVVLIFVVLLFQFRRFRTVSVVMASMPLALLGAFGGLALMGYSFGFTSFLGIIGLMGIVVRNGIILVSYADDLRHAEGLSAQEAALAAGKRRMRPIYLTSMAAAIGVVPMILSGSTLWGPLGTVTCFGLLTAMVLTLYVLPVLYALVVGDSPTPGTSPAAPLATRPKVAAKTALLLLTIGTGALLSAPAAAAPTSAPAPVTLEQLKRSTRDRNAAVRAAKLGIEAAKETRKAAYTKYFPQASATLAGSIALNPLVELETPGGNLPVYDGNSANLANPTQFAFLPGGTIGVAQKAFVGALTATQPLFAGGRIRNGNRLARIGIKVAESKHRLATRDAVAATEAKYWQLVALEEKLRTLGAYEKLLASLDKQVSSALRSGLVTRNDQLKVRLKRAEAALGRQRLERGLRLARRDLGQHAGLPRGDMLRLADTLGPPTDPTPLRSQRRGAARRRPELRLLAQAVRAQELQERLAKGKRLPTVAVGASLLRMDLQGLPGSTNALLFGTVSVPLSDIWSASHEAAGHRKRRAMLETRLKRTKELVTLEIRKRWDDLKTAYQATKVARRALEQADVNVKEHQDRYENGLVPFSDLLEAQVLRQQVLDRRVDARRAYWLARAAYRRAVARD